MTEVSTVLTGAADWRPTNWASEYYPEDLPSEWRLSYYANEYSTVLIKMDEWMLDDQREVLDEMLVDCHKEFRPVLSINTEINTPEQADAFVTWLASLDEDIGLQRLAGVMLSDIDAALDHEVLQRWRDSIPAVLPIAIAGNPAINEAGIEWFQTRQISPVFYTDGSAVEDWQYWLCLVSLTGQNRALASALTAVLERRLVSHPLCLVATSGFEDISRLKEMTTILSLINK